MGQCKARREFTQISLCRVRKEYFQPKGNDKELLLLIKTVVFTIWVVSNVTVKSVASVDLISKKCHNAHWFCLDKTLRRHRSINVDKLFLWRIISACAFPVTLYFSPVSFLGLINNGFTSTWKKTCLCLLSSSYIYQVIISQLVNSCTLFAYSTLSPWLSNASSTSSTHSSFELLRCRQSLASLTSLVFL